MQRFALPIESCQGDAKRLRQCLVSGYWRNGARWMADGTYRSVRGNVVRIFLILWLSIKAISDLLVQTLHVHPNSVLFTRKPTSGWVVFHEMEETKKTQYALISCYSWLTRLTISSRIRILTEIESDWLLEYGHKYHDKRTGAGVNVG